MTYDLIKNKKVYFLEVVLKKKTEKEFVELIHSKRFVAIFFIVMSVIYAVGWIVLVKNENRIDTLEPEDVVINW